MVKIIIAVGVVLVVALIAFVVFLQLAADPVQTDGIAKFRDISLIFVTPLLCLLLIANVALFAGIAALVIVLRNVLGKAEPLMDKVGETVDTVRGTAAYAGEAAVSPAVKVASILAGVRGATVALFRASNRSKD